jgi:hypothetical protein
LNVLAVDHSSDEVADGFAAGMCVRPTPQRGIGFTTTSFGEMDLCTGWPLRLTNRHFARHVKRNDAPSFVLTVNLPRGCGELRPHCRRSDGAYAEVFITAIRLVGLESGLDLTNKGASPGCAGWVVALRATDQSSSIGLDRNGPPLNP